MSFGRMSVYTRIWIQFKGCLKLGAEAEFKSFPRRFLKLFFTILLLLLPKTQNPFIVLSIIYTNNVKLQGVFNDLELYLKNAIFKNNILLFVPMEIDNVPVDSPSIFLWRTGLH